VINGEDGEGSGDKKNGDKKSGEKKNGEKNEISRAMTLFGDWRLFSSRANTVSSPKLRRSKLAKH